MTRTHTYEATVDWTGTTGGGYEFYSRTHEVVCAPAETGLTMSGDPAFRGDPRRLNPEQLLLAAASSCQVLSFLAVAARARLDVVAYHDEAEAVMPEGDKPVRITSIVLRPTITIRGEASDERIRHLIDVAHRECFIANSLASSITIEPTLRRV